MWGPDDSVHALDAVIAAVEKVANNTHLSPEKLKRAKHVAEDIKSDIEAVEGGNLTKHQAHERVGAAMKELMAFEEDLTKPPHGGADRLAALKKALAEKKAELANDQNMIKLLNLKKQLAEKKLMLQKLLMRKAEAESARKADEADAAKTGALVKKLLAMVKNASAAPKSDTNKTLQAALGMVRAREGEVSASLTRMEARHNKSEASLDAFALPAGNMSRGIDKARAMLKHLRGQERHLYKKARAAKQVELKELEEMDANVGRGDVAGLQQVLTKLDGQAAKDPRSFLH